jgi:hypothetical protein
MARVQEFKASCNIATPPSQGKKGREEKSGKKKIT